MLHTSLAAPVASLPSCAQRTTIGRSAIPADVAQLPASVAFHGLSLAVSSVMVRPAALVASGRPHAAEPAPSEPTANADADTNADAVSSATDTARSPTKCVSGRAIPSLPPAAAARPASQLFLPSPLFLLFIRVRRGSYQMAGITAIVAPGTSSCSGESQRGAIGLDVAESLAVVALLGIRGPRLRAHVRLVTCRIRKQICSNQLGRRSRGVDSRHAPENGG